MKDVEKDAKKLLRRLGADGTYLGFLFAAYGVAKVVEEPELLTHISKGLYVDLAAHFHVSTGSVERNIRTIRQLIWKKADREFLKEVFPNSQEKEPANAEFIRALAEYLGEGSGQE